MAQINEELIEKTKARIEALKERLARLESPLPPMLTVNEMRRNALHLALKRNAGNRTHAAVELAISIRTIRNWIKKYGESDEVSQRPGPGGL